jgi:hypothetical protein
VPRSKASACIPARGRVSGLEVDEQVVHEHRGHLEVRRAQRPADRPRERERDAELDVVHRGQHAFDVGDLVLE